MQIRLENLKKTYTGNGGSVTAVKNVSLEIPENTIFGIIGKSGAGKSSLVRLVSLLEKPDEGSVWYGNDRVDNLSKKDVIQRRRKSGMIFQNFNLFTSRTAAKNIAYPLEICGTPATEINSRVKEMLALVGLEDKGNSPISALSGGQKQRIAIARALATRPDILFCDEATSALDPQTTRSILNLIREIQKKMSLTVVMITHQMEVVRDACDMVAVVDNGEIVERGKVADIFSHPKADITKDFIAHIAPSETEKDSTEFVRWTKEQGKYILHFMGTKTGDPVLCEMAKKFNVTFNIYAAGIQHLAESEVGIMHLDIDGDEQEVKKALEFLESQNVHTEKNNSEEQ